MRSFVCPLILRERSNPPSAHPSLTLCYEQTVSQSSPMRCFKNGLVQAFYGSWSRSSSVFGVDTGVSLCGKFWSLVYSFGICTKAANTQGHSTPCLSREINPPDSLFVKMERYSESSKVCWFNQFTLLTNSPYQTVHP